MRLTNQTTPRTGICVLLCAMFAMVLTALALAMPASAHAETIPGQTWNVTYTTDGTMVDDYSAQEWATSVGGLQPGDDISFTINLKEENADTADWYMANEVLATLEQSVHQYTDDEYELYAQSAYKYRLTYTGPGGSKTLFDSTEVGGDDTQGLLDATSALDEFFYLDTLAKGQTGKVELYVALDGETEQNAYFDTLAQVQMKFAVEPVADNPSKPSNGTNTGKGGGVAGRGVVQTGDDTNLLPYYIAMLVSGCLLLLLAGSAWRRRKNDKRGGHAR